MSSIKIAFPTNDKKTIFPHIGRAKGFLIVEVLDGKVVREDYVPNTFTGGGKSCESESHHHTHSQNCSPFSKRHNEITEKLAGVTTVIARGMGPGIQIRLQSAGIKPVITPEKDIDSAITKFIEGKLEIIEDYQCAHHKHHH